MLKFLTKLLICLIVFTPSRGQVSDKKGFQSPLKIPLLLSGNFGELRATHFHAGLDFKTQGKIGQPVLAGADGHISRIKIESGGYGKAIYIAHPGGYTTVYAHLDRFTPEVESYVKKQQYARQRYEVDLTLPDDLFLFKQGALIAYSGNTGRSGGPHLHFEIRKTADQMPVNGLLYHFPVTDNMAPEFRSLVYYAYRHAEPNAIQCERNLIKTLIRKNDTSYIIKDEIPVQGAYLGFAAEVYDFLNGSANKCGVYELSLYIDDTLYYAFTIDAISFAQTRYVNAHMDYDIKVHEGRSTHRLFALPHNELPIYRKTARKGIMALADYESHNAKIVATDAYGNRSSLMFTFRRQKDPDGGFQVPDLSRLIEWDRGRTFGDGKLSIEIPPEALYQDINFSYNLSGGEDGVFDDTLQIHYPAEPLHKAMTVRYSIDAVADSLEAKLLFGRIREDGSLVSEGGAFSQGRLEMTTRNFGKYMVCMDTIAPEIKYLGYSAAEEIIRFQISDEFSGIRSYCGYIDGNWALFEYDSKSGTLHYKTDKERIKTGIEHTVKVVVSDQKDNESEHVLTLRF